jgi:CDP-6-deoxy-D-xylo-4-hexulose-3-dehydrase
MSSTFVNEQKTKEELCKFIINAERLSMGYQCKRFENEFAKWQGRKYAVLFNSGSSANLAIMQTLKNIKYLRANDNVGFSALTWATNVMPIIQMGFNPIPFDVRPSTLNVNTISGDLQAMFLTNALGFCDDIESLADYCHRRGILLIEDNCESLGSEYKGKKLGNFGVASTFSFFVGHHMSTVEGGMVCTDDFRIYESLKMVRSHGWTRDLERPDESFAGKYTFHQLAYNLRPTEITGFIGLNQMQYLDEGIKKRHELFIRWNDLTGNKIHVPKMNLVSNFAFPVLGMPELKEKFVDVEIRPIIAGNIIKQPFCSIKENMPFTDEIADYGFYIPNRPDLTDEEIATIEELLVG